jgi:hypothetical protein
MKSFILLLSLLTIGKFCSAQQNYILSGVVKDKRGEPLPGVAIYVSDYKLATATDNQGKYSLKLKPGSYTLLIQLIGFKSIDKPIIIEDKDLRTDIVLTESTTQLAEVTIKPDPHRMGYLSTFKTYFIGLTDNAEKCKILNSDLIRFDYDSEKRVLSATTDDFLMIENQALGYRIKFLVKEFQYDYRTGIVFYEGFPHYEDLPGSAAKKEKWEKKRIEAYNGSSQHFFSALFNNRSKEEGFKINKLIRNQEQEYLADSIAESQVGGLTSTTLTLAGTTNFRPQRKAVQNKLEKLTSGHRIDMLNRAEILTDTLVHEYNQDIKKIKFTNVLYVIYTKEKESSSYLSKMRMSVSRPPDLDKTQISLITLQSPTVFFYKNGSINNPRSMLYSGYWAWEKVADSVPMDYVPPVDLDGKE